METKPTYEQLEKKVKLFENDIEFLNILAANNLKSMEKIMPLYRQDNPYKVMWLTLRKFLIKFTKTFEKEDNKYSRMFNIFFIAIIMRMNTIEEETYKKFYRNKLGNEDEIPQDKTI